VDFLLHRGEAGPIAKISCKNNRGREQRVGKPVAHDHA
jgi:hypothetical protein